MAQNRSNNVLVRELPFVLAARWETSCYGEKLRATADGVEKPVLLVPSKRRQKVATFPELHMRADLTEIGREAGVVNNVTIDELEGKEVVFELTNKYWKTPSTIPLIYKTTLQNFSAVIQLSESEVRDVVFGKNGTLNANVNENLLDFTVRIRELELDTESDNRILVYRKKVLVFVPGLLGSTLAIVTSEGPVQVYPNIYPTVSEKQESELSRVFDTLTSYSLLRVAINITKGHVAVAKLAIDASKHRKLGILECDADGKPLFETKAELFRLLGALPFSSVKKKAAEGVVYDVQDVMQEQWEARAQYTNRPEGFQPFIIHPWAYDWRLDLEDTTQRFFTELKDLQTKILTSSDDTDDLFSIGGHSTGGVINRRLCGMPGANSLVEHSFFMNAPFRGAPKAIGVMLFGGAPPVKGWYSEMMPPPLIDPNSMIHVSANLPIVYYLAPSNAYPDVVSTVSDSLRSRVSTFKPPANRDVEKENMVNVAISTGVYHPVRSVPASTIQVDRAKLAIGAAEWHTAWWDCGRRDAYGVFWDQTELQKYNRRILARNENLRLQDSLRSPMPTGWNQTIAGRAAKFHEQSESDIGQSTVELYIFWSEKNATPGSVDIELDGAPENISLLEMGIPVNDYFNEGKYPAYDINGDFDFRFQWWTSKRTREWVKFSGKIIDGDGTVPRASLLGIGTPNAKIFAPLPGNPAHVPAPNSEWLWDRVLDVLTSRNVSSYLVNEPAVNKPFAK